MIINQITQFCGPCPS